MAELELCCECDLPTGRAGKGDDSLYTEAGGPFCEECFVPDDEDPEEVEGEEEEMRSCEVCQSKTRGNFCTNHRCYECHEDYCTKAEGEHLPDHAPLWPSQEKLSLLRESSRLYDLAKGNRS